MGSEIYEDSNNNGSPRKNGDTKSLIKYLTESLEGEYKIVDTYFCNIKPCIDCRYCYKNPGCSINDDMTDVYEYIKECDNIVIASPIYFAEITGQLLAVMSRLQTFFCARFYRGETPITKPKKGGVILVGGGDGGPEKAYETACTLLHHMNSRDIAPLIVSHNTDNVAAKDDLDAVEQVKKLAGFFNSMK